MGERNKYEPGFIGWLFTVIMAAGFGTASANYLLDYIKEKNLSDGNLEFVDSGCWNRELVNKTNNHPTKKFQPTCELVYENTGDKISLVTSVSTNGEIDNSFVTNLPGGYRENNYNYREANYSVIQPSEFLIVHVPVEEKEWDKAIICLYERGDKTRCDSPNKKHNK